jgi:hypothetical protein
MLNHKIIRIIIPEERLKAKNFINAYHSYIKYADRPSRKLYWNLYEDDILVGVFALGSAFDRNKHVKEFMIKNNLKFNEVANNIVYCLYGQKDKNAGTKFLKLCRLDAIKWWNERYGDTLKAFQTFILPPRTGAMYKADNWKELGFTTGGKTMTTKTLYGDERIAHPEAEIRTFKNGEIKYILREFKNTQSKLIFMKINKINIIRENGVSRIC